MNASALDVFFFGIYPYLASVVFFLGCLIRYDREQYTWKAGSSQIMHDRKFRIASIMFHVGILAIFAGHFAGLVIPYELWTWLGISLPAKQLIAMGVGGFFGIICFIGLTMLVHRRLFNPRVRATTTLMDTLILLVIYAQLILGLLTIFVSTGHMDGEVMHDLMSWSRYLLTFRPVQAVEYIHDVHWIYKAHVNLGVTLFVLFPFSRLVHIWSVPVGYLGRNYQVVRSKISAAK
ncbi:respiratory nitrate reductase subunit gamma [Natronospirillum operosum]|uniref:nitrate reductase (quinone) n=1 Tax=Natronospirillum operosum TaxID=2759953 RepID=A0A4Z0WCY5_9GAMM|nr:respiratory nitrate reductase subunit gamma [Natronospirillum operosum]TGG92794.1 respiratory nitrate reductase subunit gamma [Natronospirillum operosum]